MELNDVKKHLNIDASFTDDDAYILSLMAVAENAVKCHINVVSLTELGDELPASVRHAILLLVGSLYLNREAVSDTNLVKVPYSYEYLLSPYIQY
jgi:uncharacterized phage protein (predicted DNA packaging)